MTGKHGKIAVMKSAVAVAVALSAWGFIANPMSVRAQSADAVLCDRLAADPTDPDKPADVKGVAAIAPSDIAVAIK